MSFTKLKKVQIDALFAGICAMGNIPLFVVAANHPDTMVPEGYSNEGFITLNLSGNAVRNFSCDDKEITYSASFAGKGFEVAIPYDAIVCVYPREDVDLAFDFPLQIPKVFVKPESKPEAKPVELEEVTHDSTAEVGACRNLDANVNWAKDAFIVK